jgi:FlaA1/EpsC-like NDP-sugar epimerase
MTIPEACQLILQAGALGKGGETFILEMGTPVRIADMARDLIKLSGKEPDKDIEIVFTGLRPGEKLSEELITEGEGIVSTKHKKIMVLKNVHSFAAVGQANHSNGWLVEKIRELYELAGKQDGCGIKEKMREIVPEYRVMDSECVF